MAIGSPGKLTGSLLERLAGSPGGPGGESRAAVTFAGQGAEVLPGLTALLDRRPELDDRLDAAAEVLARLVASPAGEASGRFRYGFDVRGWVDDPGGAPPAAYVRSCAVGYPLVLLAQVLAWNDLCALGLPPAALVGVTGHSSGLLAALAVAEDPLGPLDDGRLARWLEIAFRTGLDLATAGFAVPAGPAGPDASAPMAAVSGARLDQLVEVLDEVNPGLADPAQAAVVGLVNAPDRHVVSGPPATLDLLRARLAAIADSHSRARAGGRPPEVALRHRWEALAVDVPFHWPGLAAACDRHLAWLADGDLVTEPGRLALPVLLPADGCDLRTLGDRSELARAVARSQFVEPVRWDRTVAALVAAGADWILDLGPGVEVARLTGRNVRGLGSRVLPLASPEGLRILATRGAAPHGPDLRYADLAPRLVTDAGGRAGDRPRLDNRYTRATGQPPVVLPGMTPTTADAPIVAAAANAGYSAELAGGGQPASWIFRERLVELGELLEPGVGIVLNSLYLDRPLWSAQIGSGAGAEGLLFAAKRAGAPFVGLTVSAGIPEVDEAVALLDRLRAAGMVRNAFKPGTVDQIRQVLAIADAAPRHTILVHIEGGRAGGHHSYEDLDGLLLATYHDLRVRPNVVVGVGGGVGSPERAAELLTGRWALRYGEPVMPVDAVLVGTAAMACAEAAASPQVKAALVDLAGSSSWVPRGGTAGGVHSGRSSLDADIHVADNAAARAAALLAEVAGDATAVAACHDEIVTALAATAKPWFGDVRTMTYGAVLERFTALCATGRHGRYEDGTWPDPTTRTRAQTLYHLSATRLTSLPAPAGCGSGGGGSAGSAWGWEGLDDPVGALAAFRAAFPEADATLVHPADALAFVEVCEGPGKPVPFVTVIDAEVRRRYLADALWQAQDDRYPADAVLAIPGPASVAGITRADEPVAEMLARFEQATIDELVAAGAAAQPGLDRVADAGMAPAPFADLAQGRCGVLAGLCVTPVVVTDDGRSAPNPLWTLVAPADDVTTEVDPDGTLVRLVARPPESTDRVVAEATTPTRVEVSVTMADRDLVLPFERVAGTFHQRTSVPDLATFHRTALVADSPAGDSGWVCPPATISAYRAVTGARHTGVPLDLAFSLAWPALVSLLTETGEEAMAGLPEQLAALVHQSHRVVAGPAWPPHPGEQGEATAQVREVRNFDHGRHVDVHVEVTSDRGMVAKIDAGLVAHVPPPAGVPVRHVTQRLDREITLAGPAEHELLIGHEAITVRPSAAIAVGDRLTADVDTSSAWPAGGGPARHRAHGRLLRGGEVVADVALDRPGDEAANPVDALVDVLAPPADRRRERPRLDLARTDDTAPADMAPFARIGGDHNPLHRSVVAARRAGLDRPVVHGMWTAARAAAFVVDDVCDSDAGRLADWSVRFTAPVPLGAELSFAATRVAVEDGRWRVEVVVRTDDAADAAGGGGQGTVVAMATARVGPPVTALVFPGQGTQRPGMGADERSRSRAARAVWDRADAHTRAHQGWSVLDVVERNPAELRLADGTVVRHPRGVLHRTELTQVALVTQAAAQLAELRAGGALAGDPADDHGLVAAGHSVGEYAALLALGVVSLEAALDLVFARGRAMQEVVARDAAGASPFGLAAVDPFAAGLDAVGLADLVASVAVATGALAEVVNHNAARQYVVAGTTGTTGANGTNGSTGSLDELARRLTGPRGSPALRRLDGIDVPFHSSALAPAADRLRPHLERLVGEVDHRRLVGRWIPNPTGRPFTLPTGIDDPDAEARRMLIDLLARQVAAPVRWIETQDALLAPPAAGGLGARRQIEVGPAHAPVLTDLARLTPRSPTIDLLHVHHDRPQILFAEQPPPAPDPDPDPDPEPASAPAPTPPTPATTPAVSVEDREVTAGEALRLVLAAQARVRLDQLRDDETLDELFQGVSSRRNQVLIDLGREFELAGTDGVLELPLVRLADEIGGRAPRYRFPGTYLQATIAAGLTRALGRSGLARRDAVGHVTSAWGLGPGLAEHVLVTLVMGTRPGASARGGPLGEWADDLPPTPDAGRDLLDRAVEHVARAQGLDLRPLEASRDGGGHLDAAAVRRAGERIEGALLGAARRLVTGLDRPWPADGDPLAPTNGPGDAERLAVLDRELGADRAAQVTGRFDHRRNVRFTAPTTTARWDLVALYHDALARRRPEDELRAEVERLTLHAADRTFAATARWFTARAHQLDRPDVATILAPVTERSPKRRRVPLVPAAVRPTVEIEDDGRLTARDVPDDEGRRSELIERVGQATGLGAGLRRALVEAPDLVGTVALVTGAGPGSIAAEVVRQLLRGGATVVATTSNPTRERRHWWREQYRTAAAPGAQLHLVPANLAAYADIDALVEWLGDPVSPHPHRSDLDNPPLVPDLVIPFAAVPTTGDATDAGAAGETAVRVQLLGVERLVARLAEQRGRRGAPDPVTVLLPLSPNHGDLGGDGTYGETKAGLEVLARRARAEHDGWGRHARVIGARIGWVRGTGLMQANDLVAEGVEERLGVRTFSAAEMGWLLAAAVSTDSCPDDLDLTGGLADVPDLRAALTPLAAELAERAAVQRRRHDLAQALTHRLRPPNLSLNPSPPPYAIRPTRPGAVAARPMLTTTTTCPTPQPAGRIAAEEMVVIVGMGELGPCGTALTRFALEVAGEPLPDAAVVELAWLCGLAEFRLDGYRGRWVDTATGAPVDEAELADRYGTEVLSRVGLRPLEDDGVVDPNGHQVLTTVHLDDDVGFEVADEATARSFLAADPTHTEIRRPAQRHTTTWTVTRKAGAPVQVPRRTPHTRRVAGQLPTGLDPARFGVPGDLLVTADRMALVNLACTAEAFRQAGIEPEELLAAVHPAEVANTQGAGMGGMASVRHLLHDHLLDRERQGDRLQESLGNVVAAHVVQGYVGSYGPMVHPVAACATAAVSLEVAHDLIRSGRARAVVAGGYDDLTPEGMVGFGDMHATAPSDELDALGLDPGESSRANDVRRRGFVESQGGGAFLVVRGDVALDLGLPVQGVLAYAGSFGDGIHTSIPAPGVGVLAAALGGTGSPLATALRRHGLDVDDIALVSKHDTSTELNDPNEADLHQRLQDALGRTPGNPLLVVSQKTVTGHAKGGAAAWQVAGVLQTMATGWVPGNRNLDRLDPAVAGHDHLVHGHRALRCAEPVRAALVTSLGFGHVSALLALAHPATFVDALADDERTDYLRRAAARRAGGERRRLEVRHGLATVPLRRTDRRVPASTTAPTGLRGTAPTLAIDPREAEAAALLDPTTRVGPDGVLRPGSPADPVPAHQQTEADRPCPSSD